MTNLVCPECKSNNVSEFMDTINKDRIGKETVQIPVRRCEDCNCWDSLATPSRAFSLRIFNHGTPKLSFLKDEQAINTWNAWGVKQPALVGGCNV